MAQAILNVPDISCGHCERAITSALAPLEGVRSVRVDIPARRVHLEYDEATVGIDRVRDVLAEEDYPVASVEAGDRPRSGDGLAARAATIGCSCCGSR
jgi:copper chaperone